MKREEKKVKVKELNEKFKVAKVAVLTDFRGMRVGLKNNLHRELKKSGGEFLVVKNNLARLAIPGTDFESFREDFCGPVGIAFGYDDVVLSSKALVKFITKDSPLTIKSGLLKKRKITLKELKELANIASREILLAQLLATMNAPLNNFVYVLGEMLRGPIRALNAIKAKKG